MKEEKESYTETSCGKCASNNINKFGGLSGWNFYVECKDCGTKHSYYVQDGMGCEGCSPFYLNYIGEDWDEEFRVDELALKLQFAEKGWENKNGKYYEDYDRLIYTAKNLLNEQ